MGDELSFSRSILDPIHGLIQLTPEEAKLIDSPIFRRLRGTKQNGLLWLVFPSATHTRFEHSLGAMFLADAMWHAVLANSKMAARKSPPRVAPRERALEGQAVDLTDLPPLERVQVHRVLRLAALCHDLGHGPLSHTFDSFAPTVAEVRRLLQDVRLASLTELAEDLLAWQQEPPLQENKRVPHEVMSCLFFAHAWHEMFEGGEPDIPRLVAGALLGEPLFGAAAGHELESWLPFIHDMVASAPADADRMDYLVRDTTSIGVNYGLFDRNRLLKSFLCYRGTAGGLDAHSTYRLGLKRSGIRAVENLVQARFELFVQVYYHKTNRAIELMLRQVAALSSSTSFINWPDLDTVIQQYCDLDDHEFLRRLSRHDSRGIHHLVERIRGRRLWKRLADISVVRDDNGLVSKNKTRTSADILRGQVEKEVPGAEIQVDVIDPKATKDLAKGAALLDRHRSEVYTATDTVSWTDSSAIIRTLGEEEKAIARLYTSTEDSALLDRMRETVRGMRGTDGVAA